MYRLKVYVTLVASLPSACIGTIASFANIARRSKGHAFAHLSPQVQSYHLRATAWRCRGSGHPENPHMICICIVLCVLLSLILILFTALGCGHRVIPYCSTALVSRMICCNVSNDQLVAGNRDMCWKMKILRTARNCGGQSLS